MKRIFKFITVLLMMIMVCETVFICNNEVVRAEESENVDERQYEGECSPSLGSVNFTASTLKDKKYIGYCNEIYKLNNKDPYGSVTITSKGMITVNYEYGISELLIYATGKRPKENHEKDELLDETNSSTLLPKIIHVSGEQGKGSVTINLFNYFNYDDRLSISMIYSFANENDSDSRFFTPLYCSHLSGDSSCAYTDNSKHISNRIKSFKNYYSTHPYIDKLITKYRDGKGLVYLGDSRDGKVINTFEIKEVGLIVDNSSIDKSKNKIEVMIYDTIIPVLLGILGFAAVVSCSVLGYQIVKSADEPQERAQKVHNLKIILLGIGVAFVILMLIKPIINIIENYL